MYKILACLMLMCFGWLVLKNQLELHERFERSPVKKEFVVDPAPMPMVPQRRLYDNYMEDSGGDDFQIVEC